jgi:hypothetical protein
VAAKTMKDIRQGHGNRKDDKDVNAGKLLARKQGESVKLWAMSPGSKAHRSGPSPTTNHETTIHCRSHTGPAFVLKSLTGHSERRPSYGHTLSTFFGSPIHVRVGVTKYLK